MIKRTGIMWGVDEIASSLEKCTSVSNYHKYGSNARAVVVTPNYNNIRLKSHNTTAMS